MPHPVIVREKTDEGNSQFDLYSRLNEDRIIFFDTYFSDETCSLAIAQVLFLANKSPEEDITFYINSGGGSVSAGLALFDTLNMVSCDIRTICVGNAASMGAFLLSAGTKGKRFMLPSARAMIHQVSGGAEGTTKDVKIRLEEQQRLNDYLNKCLAKQTGKTIKQIEDATDRDHWMSAEEAVKFGLVDSVLYPTKKNAWK